MTTVNNPNSPNWIGLKGHGDAFTAAVAKQQSISERIRLALRYLENKNMSGADRVCATNHLRAALKAATGE